MSRSALDFVRDAGVVIASDGAEYHKIGEFHPTDATSNPSLVYGALMQPEYSHILDDAVKYAHTRLPSGTLADKANLALDKALIDVGLQILNIIPGRVSLSVDPRLGYSRDGIISKSLALASLLDEHASPNLGPSPSQTRILVKIPATSAGIHAAHILESVHGIHTNLTLIFSPVQALACAQAGVSVVSPFIGRVKDWHDAQAIIAGSQRTQPLPVSEHPGIALVRTIRAAYAKYGYTKTQVMAAGFRKVEEIIEVARGGTSLGPHFVTLPPDLLDGLRRAAYPEGLLDESLDVNEAMENLPSTPTVYFSSTPNGPTEDDLKAFNRDSALEGISLDKVPEGLSKFSVDAHRLEEAVKDALVQLANSESPIHVGRRSEHGVGQQQQEQDATRYRVSVEVK